MNLRYAPGRSLSYLFYGIDKFGGGFSLFGHLNHIGVHISDSFWITEGHTFRIAITVIALHGHPVLDVEEGMSKGACDDAGPASNTQILVNDHTVIILRLPMAGFGRTDLYTIGFFAVIAGHGEVDPHVFPFDHLDAGPARIACPGMMHGTD